MTSRLSKLLDKARQSPVYFLCGLELQFCERIQRYQKRRTKTTSLAKKISLGCKITALKECLYDVRRELIQAEKKIE